MSYDLPWPSIYRAIEFHDVDTVLELAKSTPQAVADWETCHAIFRYLARQTDRWNEVYDLITLYVDDIKKNNAMISIGTALADKYNLRALADLAELFPSILEYNYESQGQNYIGCGVVKRVKYPLLAYAMLKLGSSNQMEKPCNQPAEFERLLRANPHAIKLKSSKGEDFLERYAARDEERHAYVLAALRVFPELATNDPQGGINPVLDGALRHFGCPALLELLETVPAIWQIPGVKDRLMRRMWFKGLLTFPRRLMQLANTPAQAALPAPKRASTANLALTYQPQGAETNLATETGRWLVKEGKCFDEEAFRQASKLKQQLLVLGQLLATAAENTPARDAVETLMRDDLPKLVNAYVKIPEELRHDSHLGQTPATLLEAGLRRLSLKADELTNQLKKDCFEELDVHVRYLGYQTNHADGNSLQPCE